MMLVKSGPDSKNVTFSVILLIFAIILLIGCPGGGGSGDDDDDDNGSTPEILDVEIPATLTVGETWTLRVELRDEDMDIESLIITEYYPSDSNTPHSGPNTLPLPNQTAIQDIWELPNVGPVTPPIGEYRQEFQLEDGEGNLSTVWIEYCKVVDAP